MVAVQALGPFMGPFGFPSLVYLLEKNTATVAVGLQTFVNNAKNMKIAYFSLECYPHPLIILSLLTIKVCLGPPKWWQQDVPHHPCSLQGSVTMRAIVRQRLSLGLDKAVSLHINVSYRLWSTILSYPFPYFLCWGVLVSPCPNVRTQLVSSFSLPVSSLSKTISISCHQNSSQDVSARNWLG